MKLTNGNKESMKRKEENHERVITSYPPRGGPGTLISLKRVVLVVILIVPVGAVAWLIPQWSQLIIIVCVGFLGFYIGLEVLCLFVNGRVSYYIWRSIANLQKRDS